MLFEEALGQLVYHCFFLIILELQNVKMHHTGGKPCQYSFSKAVTLIFKRKKMMVLIKTFTFF